MLTLKVGVMPGKLQEVAVEAGTSAKEIFEIAGVDYTNHEIRLDGVKINEDTTIENGGLLVAMKMIKGNAGTMKVGVMPGRLQEISYESGETAREILNRAGVDYEGYEIRLDGNKIDVDKTISQGGLLVAMKMIKGNAEKYVANLSEKEIEMILDVAIPTIIPKHEVTIYDTAVCVEGDIVVERGLFDSIYELKDIEEDNTWNTHQEVIENVEETIEKNMEEVHECKCNNAIDIIEKELEVLNKDYRYFADKAYEINAQMVLLNKIKERIQG